ncbi:glycogen-binding domain-containing protein [Desulfobacula toluolica]|uniref:glycogen-binding domain-containing protein n=1 Tax=Desulfobacula toluolica TaxID=28223 RepID=UPI001E5E5A35|nr:glycogen-binding domain-containing protein [Desulfobacula toluolica]
MLIFFSLFQSPGPHSFSNRFVLFEPAADQVELTGSFIGWQRISMKKIGNSGYWELNLPVVSGEHRYAYILNNDSQIADPTLPAREKDDFGSENCIFEPLL